MEKNQQSSISSIHNNRQMPSFNQTVNLTLSNQSLTYTVSFGQIANQQQFLKHSPFLSTNVNKFSIRAIREQYEIHNQHKIKQQFKQQKLKLTNLRKSHCKKNQQQFKSNWSDQKIFSPKFQTFPLKKRLQMRQKYFIKQKKSPLQTTRLRIKSESSQGKLMLQLNGNLNLFQKKSNQNLSPKIQQNFTTQTEPQ